MGADLFGPLFGQAIESMQQPEEDETLPGKREKFADSLIQSVIEPPDQYVSRRMNEQLFGGKPPTKMGKASLFLTNLLGGMAAGPKWVPPQLRAQKQAMTEYELLQKNRSAEIAEGKANMMGQLANQKAQESFYLSQQLNAIRKQTADAKTAHEAETVRKNKALEAFKTVEGIRADKALSIKEKAQKLAEQKWDYEQLYGDPKSPDSQFFTTLRNSIFGRLPEEEQKAVDAAYDELVKHKALGQVRTTTESGKVNVQSLIGPDMQTRTVMTALPPVTRTTGPAGLQGATPMNPHGMQPGVPQQLQGPPQQGQPPVAPSGQQPGGMQQSPQPSAPVTPASSGNSPAALAGSAPPTKYDANWNSGQRVYNTGLYKTPEAVSQATTRRELLTQSRGVLDLALSLNDEKRLDKALSGLGAGRLDIADRLSGVPGLGRMVDVDPSMRTLYALTSAVGALETYKYTGKQLNLQEFNMGQRRRPQIHIADPTKFLDAALKSSLYFKTGDWKLQLETSGVPTEVIDRLQTSAKLERVAEKQLALYKTGRLSSQALMESLDPAQLFADDLRKAMLDVKGGAPGPVTVTGADRDRSKKEETSTPREHRFDVGGREVVVRSK